MRAVVARPGCPPVEVDTTGELAAVQALVGGYLELLPNRGPRDGLDVFVNEEGLLRALPFNRTVRGFPVVGPVVVLASTPEGDTRGLTPDEVARALRLLEGGA